MDIVDLLLESDPATYQNEVIQYVFQIFKSPNSSNCRIPGSDLGSELQGSDDSIICTQVVRTTGLQFKTPQKRASNTSILEYSFLTPSDDAPFVSERPSHLPVASSPVAPLILEPHVQSLPIASQLLDSKFSDPSDDFSTQTGPTKRPSPARDMLLKNMDVLLSDPIEASSAPSSPPKKKKKFTKSKDNGEKLWRDSNRVTRKKEEILGEMIVEISACLESELKVAHFDELFSNTTVRFSYTDLPLVSWKRQITANYNADEDVFVPCEPTEKYERVVVLYFGAQSFVDRMVDSSLGELVSRALRRARTLDPLLKYHVILLVNGFNEVVRKLKAAEDRRYRERLLDEMNDLNRRKGDHEEPQLTAAEVQNLLRTYEAKIGVTIFLTKSKQETIDWLHSFTYTIGNSLYDKFERNPKFANVGHVRLGSDHKSTFIEMIKKFNLMTAQTAAKLYEFYSSPAGLYERYQLHDSVGTVGGKNIVPPSVNSAMRNFFRATNPDDVVMD